MAGISKDQLRKEITAILKDADLTKTSAKKVRTLLEEKLDTDLANQKKVVDDLVMEYLSKQKKPGKKGKKDDSDDEEEQDEEENGDEEDEEEEEDSEEDKKRKKPAPKRAPPKKKAKATSDSDDEPSADEKDSEDEYSPKKKTKPAPKKGRGKKKAGSGSDSDEDWGKSKPKKRGGGGGQPKGYARPLTLSKDLAKLMGESTLARHEVVKRMWALIKERNLYDPSNKQFAICDDELLKVIGEKRFRIFGMMKFLKGHFS